MSRTQSGCGKQCLGCDDVYHNTSWHLVEERDTKPQAWFMQVWRPNNTRANTILPPSTPKEKKNPNKPKNKNKKQPWSITGEVHQPTHNFFCYFTLCFTRYVFKHECRNSNKYWWFEIKEIFNVLDLEHMYENFMSCHTNLVRQFQKLENEMLKTGLETKLKLRNV